MTKPIRFTPEKQQELISRYQFCERVVEFGWIPVPPEDLGEDFIVNVYFEGQATGVSFYLQEKSVTNLSKRRKGDFLPYQFEVKDLKHWEKFAQPVVLVIWDVKLREGRWVIWNGSKGAIENVNQKRPTWRNQKKTQVYIPWNNTTDDKGLIRLRHKVGKALLPIIGKDKELSMKMTLESPGEWSNKETAKSFERFYDEGEEVTLKGDVIRSVDVPDWAKPWFDTDFTEITMGSMESKDSLVVDINIIALDGKAETMKGIELKSLKSGRLTMKLSNKHQTVPLMFEFIFSSSQNCSASVGLNNWGSNVNVSRDVLRFMQALAIGGKMQLFSIKHNSPLPVDIPIPPNPQFNPNFEFVKLVDYLCTIQAKTGQFIKLESDALSKQDLQTIAELITIIEQGKLKRVGKKLIRQFETEPPEDIFDYLKQKKPVVLTTTHNGSSAELLGQKIEMGTAVEVVTGILDMTDSELASAMKEYKANGVLQLQLADVESIVTFPNWVKDSKDKSLSQH